MRAEVLAVCWFGGFRCSTPRSGCPMVGRAMAKEIAKKLRDFWSNVILQIRPT